MTKMHDRTPIDNENKSLMPRLFGKRRKENERMTMGKVDAIGSLSIECSAPAMEEEQTIKSCLARLRLTSPPWFRFPLTLLFLLSSSFFTFRRLFLRPFFAFSLPYLTSIPLLFFASSSIASCTVSFSYSSISISYQVHTKWKCYSPSLSILESTPSVGYACKS